MQMTIRERGYQALSIAVACQRTGIGMDRVMEYAKRAQAYAHAAGDKATEDYAIMLQMGARL